MAQCVNASEFWQTYFDTLEGASPGAAARRLQARHGAQDHATLERGLRPGDRQAETDGNQLDESQTHLRAQGRAQARRSHLRGFRGNATREQIQQKAFEITERKIFPHLEIWINIAALRAIGAEKAHADSFVPFLEKVADNPWGEDIPTRRIRRSRVCAADADGNVRWRYHSRHCEKTRSPRFTHLFSRRTRRLWSGRTSGHRRRRCHLPDARILTLEDSQPEAEAVAVKDGRILELGDAARVAAFEGDGTSVVSLNGRDAHPGFYDCHVHPVMGSSDPPADLSKETSWESAAAALARHVEASPETQTNRGWVRGNVHQLWFSEDNPPTFGTTRTRFPTRWDLDEVVPDRPVVLDRSNVVIVNSEALKRAGITSSTEDPEGGVIERDSRGEPTGVLRETPATALVRQVMPPPPPRPDDETARQNLKTFFEKLLPLGITSLNVAAWSAENWRILQDVSESWRGRASALSGCSSTPGTH